MKKIFGNINEKGTLLVEAMAMLGLIAMVTPVLYKKAAERTVELQDVNASSQLRALSSAVDSYLKDNFAKITKGDTIDGIDYSSFANADNGTVGPIPLNHFADYLPYGFLTDGGAARETKLFTDDYQVWVKLEADYANYTDPAGNPQRKALSQILTGFVSATPKNAEELGQVRSSRIASMIGSNGGYVLDDSTVMGAQGIWSVPVNQFDGLNAANRPFVVSSLQPISSQGLANEDVLHRKDEPDADQELNTMETDLFMGFSENTTRNIRMVNQIIMNPDAERMVGSGNESAHNASDNMQPLTGNDAQDLDKALYIAKGGGAYIEGALNAMNSLFSVNGQGIRYFGQNETDELQPDGSTQKVTSRATDPVMKIDSTSLVYGNPGAGNAKLTVNSAGSMSFASTEVETGGTVTEAASESLYADKTNFRAGDGNFRVSKENVAGGDAKWVSVFNTGDAHEGGRTTYTWNGAVPTEDAAEATGKYEVSINGSAFVKDTLLTGKIKSYNVDTAKLRAGVSTNDFDSATYDEEYYMVVDEDIAGIGFQGMGTTKRPKLLVSDRDDTWGPNTLDTINVYQGIQMQTPNGEGGIDIAAGDTGLLAVDNSYLPTNPDEATQENIVRIGGRDGVYLSAFDENGDLYDAPVTIQGEMFRAYKNRNYKTIDTFTHQFNLLSQWMYDEAADGNEFANGAYDYFRHGSSNSSWGRVYIADSNFIMADYDGQPFVDIFAGAQGTSSVVSRFSGGFAIYDPYYDMLTEADNKTGKNTSPVQGTDAAVYVNKGIFEVRSTKDKYVNGDMGYEAANSRTGNNVRVLSVDSGGSYAPFGYSNSDKLAKNGSVYIRRGSVALESSVDSGATEDKGKNRGLTNNIIEADYRDSDKAVGYIAADRFISHYSIADRAIDGSERTGIDPTTNKSYDFSYFKSNVASKYRKYGGYEVNPAYTSVMHDIKLTTRGGARLSDILPDFINKGIYVVDTTYSEKDTDWVNSTEKPHKIGKDLGDNASAEEIVSPYAGFIPTPKCPPGYAKVVTLTPSGWAMAQAGTPVQNGTTVDIMPHNNPMEFIHLKVEDGETVQPLTFQKNTWLKAMVVPYCGKMDPDGDCNNAQGFQGWGAIMGFIYPKEYYKEFIDDPDSGIDAGNAMGENKNIVYWNLFPVYYKQLEGYATVYCYFDRVLWNDVNEVDDDYNQLNALNGGNLNYYQKENTKYIDRLNDPNLKYYDPW